MKTIRLVVWIAMAGVVQGQTTSNTNAWFMYFGDHAVGGRWGVHLEGQVRRHDFANSWQQLLLRPAVNFSLSKNVMFSQGYAYVRTHRYGEFPVAARFPEHRLYQQVLLKHSAGKVDIAHRYRLEQRWLGEVQVGSLRLDRWRRQDRFRYMLRVTVPLPRNPRYYIAAYDEILLHFRHNFGASAFDHNRAYVALGYKTGRWGNVEVGYMNQHLVQRNGRITENNHTFQLGFTSNIAFRK